MTPVTSSRSAAPRGREAGASLPRPTADRGVHNLGTNGHRSRWYAQVSADTDRYDRSVQTTRRTPKPLVVQRFPLRTRGFV